MDPHKNTIPKKLPTTSSNHSNKADVWMIVLREKSSFSAVQVSGSNSIFWVGIQIYVCVCN